MSFHPDAFWLLSLVVLVPIALWPLLRRANRAPVVFSSIDGAQAAGEGGRRRGGECGGLA